MFATLFLVVPLQESDVAKPIFFFFVCKGLYIPIRVVFCCVKHANIRPSAG